MERGKPVRPVILCFCGGGEGGRKRKRCPEYARIEEVLNNNMDILGSTVVFQFVCLFNTKISGILDSDWSVMKDHEWLTLHHLLHGCYKGNALYEHRKHFSH